MRNVLKWMGLLLFAGACGDAPTKKTGTSEIGGLGQVCYANGTCNTNLVCRDDRCVTEDPNNVSTNNISTNNISTNNISTNNTSTNNTSTNNANNSNNSMPACGNAVLEGGEVCDGANLGQNSCVTLGFSGGGTLRCGSDCQSFNTSGCFRDLCGNGRIEGTEVCDGNLLNNATCQFLGFASGTLQCGSDCTSFDTSRCQRATCGDGVIQSGEQCDSGDLNGFSCTLLGFDGGQLGCSTTDCTYNTSGCTNDALQCDLMPTDTTCTGLNAQDCACMGCLDACEKTQVLTTVYSDCVCDVCVGNAGCNTCDNDGICSPFSESCTCADCANHPLCRP